MRFKRATATEERLKRLARSIESLAGRDADRVREAERMSALRGSAPAELHAICAGTCTTVLSLRAVCLCCQRLHNRRRLQSLQNVGQRGIRIQARIEGMEPSQHDQALALVDGLLELFQLLCIEGRGIDVAENVDVVLARRAPLLTAEIIALPAAIDEVDGNIGRLADLVKTTVRKSRAQLEAGTLVLVQRGRLRLRALPIKRSRI